jgi:hypothetical protein
MTRHTEQPTLAVTLTSALKLARLLVLTRAGEMDGEQTFFLRGNDAAQTLTCGITPCILT